MRRDWGTYLVLLLLCGACWGITQPFAKIAVSEGYRHFGIIFWQFVLGGAILFVVNTISASTRSSR